MEKTSDTMDTPSVNRRTGGMSRRELLRIGLGVSGALAMSGLLAACAAAPPQAAPTSGAPTAAPPAATAASGAPTAAVPVAAPTTAAATAAVPATADTATAVPAAAPTEAAPTAAAVAETGPTRAATLIFEEHVENIDPHDHNGLTSYLLFKNIYSSLVNRDPAGEITPALATEWRVVEPTIWEFKLRQGVTFSNGEPWNAVSAKASIDRLVSTEKWGTMRQFGAWRLIASAEIVDDQTVRVITKTPFGALLSNLSLGAMMPESIAKKHLADAITDPAEIVGAGPYTMTKWEPGQSVELEANPTYWGTPKPKLQRVTIHTVPEPATRIAALQAGDADIVWALKPLQAVEQVKTNPELQVTSIDSLRIEWLAFSHKRAPFTDINLREAAQRAVDFDTIGKTVLAGEGTVCQCVIAPGTFGAANDLDPSVVEFNPERSRELLQAAGFAAGDGPAVQIISPIGEPQQVLEAIVGQLNTAGFKAKLDFMEVADFLTRRNEGDYDIFVQGFTAITGDSEFLVPAMFYGASSRNGYKNPDVDKLIDQAAAETDQAKRIALYHQASEIVWKDRANFWNYQVTLHVGAKKGLTGLVVRPDNLLPFENLDWQA